MRPSPRKQSSKTSKVLGSPTPRILSPNSRTTRTRPRMSAAKQSTEPAGRSAVEIVGLSHRYGSRLALDNLSLDIRPAELFAVLGPNGGGKTTLFRLLSTLIPPQVGGVQ